MIRAPPVGYGQGTGWIKLKVLRSCDACNLWKQSTAVFINTVHSEYNVAKMAG